MVLDFRTKGNNTYGRRKYLGIDTDTKTYTTESPRMIIPGYEISTKDYRAMIDQLKQEGYIEVSVLM